MTVELTPHQDEELQALLAAMRVPGSVSTLIGAAGTGKTTLMQFVITALIQGHTKPVRQEVNAPIQGAATEVDLLDFDPFNPDTFWHAPGVILGAPTGKAAARLRDLTSRDAATMHGLLYDRAEVIKTYDDLPENFDKLADEEKEKILAAREEKAKKTRQLVFDDPHAPCYPGDYVIIDEASMLGKKLYDEFMSYVPPSSSVLFVLDEEQLPPVKDVRGPDCDHPTAKLLEVHRQALDNPIIYYATETRFDRGVAWEARYDNSDPRVQLYDDLDSAVEWLLFQREQGADATTVTFTHKVRKHVNATVRARLGLTGPVAVGDKLVVKTNSKGTRLMNGDVVTVTAVDPDGAYAKQGVWTIQIEERPGDVFIPLNFIEGDGMDFFPWKKNQGELLSRKALHVHYGQCLTIHSAQGSQWDRVGYIRDSSYNWLRKKDPKQARQMWYTAITRAAKELVVFRVP